MTLSTVRKAVVGRHKIWCSTLFNITRKCLHSVQYEDPFIIRVWIPWTTFEPSPNSSSTTSNTLCLHQIIRTVFVLRKKLCMEPVDGVVFSLSSIIGRNFSCMFENVTQSRVGVQEMAKRLQILDHETDTAYPFGQRMH